MRNRPRRLSSRYSISMPFGASSARPARSRRSVLEPRCAARPDTGERRRRGATGSTVLVRSPSPRNRRRGRCVHQPAGSTSSQPLRGYGGPGRGGSRENARSVRRRSLYDVPVARPATRSPARARLQPRRRLPADRRPACRDRPPVGRARPRSPPPDPPRCDRHGKTFTLANAIARHGKPTLVLAHNKTLAAQLYAEFREFFPDNAVEYFVSYFDYYQPEAYLPRSDTYIEKDSSRNDEIDKLRHAATHALFERRDVIIVASVELHLRAGCPGRLRRDRAAPSQGRPVPARRRPPPPRRPPVPAQRPGPPARPFPGPRRHPGDRAGLGRPDRPGRVLRRRGRADHRGRPADRRASGRAQRPQCLPGDPLRDAGRQAQGGPRRHRGRDGAAGRRDGGPGPGPRGGPAPPADHLRPRDDARAGLLLRGRELQPSPRPARGRLPAVDPARLLPAGLAARRRREPHVDPPGRGDVQERPDPQGDPRRFRVPSPLRPRQPTADLRGVRGDRPPGDLHERDPRAVRARAERAGGRAARSGRPASSTRGSPSGRPRARSTTSSRRSGGGWSAASGPW